MSNITEKINYYSYAMAIWTDKADFIIDKKIENEKKLLEIRCFDERGEFRAYRSLISEEFKYREIANDKTYAMAIWTDKADFIADKKIENEDKLHEIRCFDENGKFRGYRILIGEDKTYADCSYDEAQYLDIDNAKTENMNDGFIYATGGGKYHLPLDAKDKKMLLTRIYYKFDEEGIAHKCDWRLVGFTNEETVGKEDNNGNSKA